MGYFWGIYNRINRCANPIEVDIKYSIVGSYSLIIQSKVDPGKNFKYDVKVGDFDCLLMMSKSFMTKVS